MPLKVKSRHGSPNWYLRGTVRGRIIDESAGTGDRRKAEEIRTRREAELLDESINGRRAVATFASAAESYLKQGGEVRYMGALLTHFGDTKLSSVDQAAVDRCALVLKPRAAPSTINRQIHTPISAVLKHAASRGLCENRPIERPRQASGKTRWLSVAEAERLIAASSPHLRPLVVFMLYTGARLSEALYLDWDAIDLARAHVDFLETKNGEPRGVPLHPLVVSVVANLPHRSGMVFRKPDGLPYPVKEDGGGQIKTAFRAACRRGKVRNATPHTLRHTWATWFYQEHRDLARLQELGGWKSLSMVKRYAHVNVAHHAAAINGLPSIDVGIIVGREVSGVGNWEAKTKRMSRS